VHHFELEKTGTRVGHWADPEQSLVGGASPFVIDS